MKLLVILTVVIGVILLYFISLVITRRNNYKLFMNATETPKNLECFIDKQAISEGLEYFKTKKIIICGLMRDTAKNINNIKKAIDTKIKDVFLDYHVLIVENDSTDGTREQLLQWMNENKKITILGCGVNVKSCKLKGEKTLGHSKNEGRIAKMVMLRNIYQDYIADNSQLFQDYDFVLMWDMDIMGTFYIDGLGSTGYIFKNSPEVNVLCSNGIRPLHLWGFTTSYTYADPYAHEEIGDDPTSEVGRTAKLEDLLMQWKEKCDSSDDGSKPVISCFGGLTMYRKASIEGKKYILQQGKNYPLCEHRTFHSQISGVYINKKLIFMILDND